jgi:hypothetical protein
MVTGMLFFAAQVRSQNTVRYCTAPVAPAPPDMGLASHLFHTLSKYNGVFPGLFTMWCFALFGPAIVTGWLLSGDPNVQYFIGWHSRAVLAIPVLLLMCHVLHIKFGRPKFYVVVLSTFIPSVLVFLVGYSHYIPISGVVDRLLSTDCSTYEMKYHIERAYRQAEGLFDDCVGRVALETNATRTAVRAGLVIQDCKEYQVPNVGGDPYARWRNEWAYLHGLEVQENCAGWCYDSPAIWVAQNERAEAKDVCSNVAASIMKGKVKRSSMRMVANAGLDMVIATFTLSIIQEIMNYNGTPDW